MDVEPREIVSFMEAVRKVAPPDDVFSQLVCHAAQQILAKLTITEVCVKCVLLLDQCRFSIDFFIVVVVVVVRQQYPCLY